MEKKRYVVSLVVEVEAFDESDAQDALHDSFGIGENGTGIVITECEWSLKNERKGRKP